MFCIVLTNAKFVVEYRHALSLRRKEKSMRKYFSKDGAEISATEKLHELYPGLVLKKFVSSPSGVDEEEPTAKVVPIDDEDQLEWASDQVVREFVEYGEVPELLVGLYRAEGKKYAHLVVIVTEFH